MHGVWKHKYRASADAVRDFAQPDDTLAEQSNEGTQLLSQHSVYTAA